MQPSFEYYHDPTRLEISRDMASICIIIPTGPWRFKTNQQENQQEITCTFQDLSRTVRERSGSVVDCLTQDPGVAG